MAAQATLHCLTGCAAGEILGLVIGTALSLSNWVTVLIAVLLAFCFGFCLTIRGLLKHGMQLKAAAKVALAADTLSITVMEIVDNAVMLLIPGAMGKDLTDPVFWGSMIIALAAAYVAAVPVNRFLIARGQGHALVHHHH